MSHLNTLEIYRKMLRAGMSENDALLQTDILENSVMTKINELKDDFASSKIISIFGAIIIGIGGFILLQLWNMTHDIYDVKKEMITINEKVKMIEDKVR
jgi:hypothetical protein